MSSTTSSSGLPTLRLQNVEGDNKCNDVIVCGYTQPANKTVVYFGGDIQDYAENMLAHRDNKHYVSWDLESTAQLMASCFPASLVVIVRPSSMKLGTFSCYSNFVTCNSLGVPSHSQGTLSGWMHLQKLIKSVHSSLAEKNITVTEKDVSLVGFSKGCVVLNQLVHELPTVLSSEEKDGLLQSVTDMYWLDGGHAGGSNTWVTDRGLLTDLASSGIRIHVHVTPYQVEDSNRPWIKKEERKFSETLRTLGGKIDRTLHFGEGPADIYTHFKLLEIFNM